MDGFRAAVFAKLNGDSTLTALLATTTSIFYRRAPLNAAFPFIVFSKNAGTPEWFFAGAYVDNQVWMFKAVDRAPSSSRAEEICKQMNAVLTDPELTLSDGHLLYMRKESDIDYEEDADPDFIVHHVGGTYRTIIDRT